ncbi:MAG: hypothetical protein QME52_09850 [Bacteroidota bacterium]|nr:hypothetical protein [Bacteroidota bacterium]
MSMQNQLIIVKMSDQKIIFIYLYIREMSEAVQKVIRPGGLSVSLSLCVLVVNKNLYYQANSKDQPQSHQVTKVHEELFGHPPIKIDSIKEHYGLHLDREHR